MGSGVMEVTAVRTDSALEVKRVMTRPPIWETVAEDGQNPEDFEPDVTGEVWLSIQAGGKKIGLYHIHKLNNVMVQIHAQILPEFRRKYSRGSGTAALAWILENVPECQKIIAWVPVIYENVKNFTESFGFQIEGTNRASYLKNGEIHDQWLLGITRSEVQKWAA